MTQPHAWRYGLRAPASLVGGPIYGLVVIAAFMLGHAAVLAAAAAIGARLLPTGTADVPWAQLDLLVGALFLAAAGYYVFQVLSAVVVTLPPGEPSGPVLP